MSEDSGATVTSLSALLRVVGDGRQQVPDNRRQSVFLHQWIEMLLPACVAKESDDNAF